MKNVTLGISNETEFVECTKQEEIDWISDLFSVIEAETEDYLGTVLRGPTPRLSTDFLNGFAPERIRFRYDVLPS